MKRSYLVGLFLMISLFAFLMTGCGIWTYIYGDSFHASRSKPRKASSGGKSTLRLKVLTAPLIDMAGLEDNKAEGLGETLETLLKKDGSLLIVPLTGYESPRTSAASSDLGVFVDPALIKEAEEMGMNILITQVLEPLNYTAKKRGIWPFTKLKGFYDVSMVVNAVDIVKGTVVLSLRETEKIKIGPVPEGEEAPPSLNEEILKEVLYDIQKRQSSELLDFLDNYGWRGTISMSEDRIRIKGGEDIGVTTGSIFEVFGKGEPIKNINGKEYYISGTKAGEIRVTDVMEDQSFAVPVGNNVFEDGQIISLKSE